MPKSGKDDPDGTSGSKGPEASAWPDLHREIELLDDNGRSPRPSGGTGARVLVATGNVELTRYVCQGLGLLDRAVQGFEEDDPERLTRRVAEVQPALLVLDADIGDTDGGFDLCARLRGTESGRSVRVLVLVDGGAWRRAEQLVLGAGADGLLAKPFNLRQVASEVGRLIDLGPRRREAR